jgi:hypothetical protein
MELDIPGVLGIVEKLNKSSFVKDDVTIFILAFGLFNFFLPSMD